MILIAYKKSDPQNRVAGSTLNISDGITFSLKTGLKKIENIPNGSVTGQTNATRSLCGSKNNNMLS